MRATWLPWRFLIRRLARSHGVVDPIALLGHMQGFSHPSEVAVPMELLRAGILFHARGLINTKVIQQNLDWVWPYWVTEQFDPHSTSFLPRAFSITHVNLTHRNWTAVGIPDCENLPIVDPRGLVTPVFDGWSLDAWLAREDGSHMLIPSRSSDAQQRFLMDVDDVRVETRMQHDNLELIEEARVVLRDGKPVCSLTYRGRGPAGTRLAVCLRPYNPEGVSFVYRIGKRLDGPGWSVGKERYPVEFERACERMVASNYHGGDIVSGLLTRPDADEVTCDVGLATSAALFPLEGGRCDVSIHVPLSQTTEHQDRSAPIVSPTTWQRALEDCATFETPDKHLKYLFDTAVRTLVLHSPGEVYPGPYTYKRFWFRDTAFLVHGLLGLGLTGRVERVLDTFPSRQRVTGYFHSQDGEWDSNGEALWMLKRFCEVTGRPPKEAWHKSITRGAQWIQRKRTSPDSDAIHAGLLPAGFSAEHLGNNDYYYWDDFWGIAGLRAAAALARHWDEGSAATYARHADDFMKAVERSLARSRDRRDADAIPASPYRRMDSGAVGSLVADYPLRLLPPGESRIMATVEFLMERCTVHGAFFQDMIHSGINAYLTMHMSQVLLRAGDDRWYDLLHHVAQLASPTGQWPEAIHPHTGGGCMGDGQHAWAAAEFIALIRNMFVREESDRLVLASGIPSSWYDAGQTCGFGPTPTLWGPVRVQVTSTDSGVRVSWDAAWRGTPPAIEVSLPGTPSVRPAAENEAVTIAGDALAVAPGTDTSDQ